MPFDKGRTHHPKWERKKRVDQTPIKFGGCHPTLGEVCKESKGRKLESRGCTVHIIQNVGHKPRKWDVKGDKSEKGGHCVLTSLTANPDSIDIRFHTTTQSIHFNQGGLDGVVTVAWRPKHPAFSPVMPAIDSASPPKPCMCKISNTTSHTEASETDTNNVYLLLKGDVLSFSCTNVPMFSL